MMAARRGGKLVLVAVVVTAERADGRVGLGAPAFYARAEDRFLGSSPFLF
jgi:hypothetical protein